MKHIVICDDSKNDRDLLKDMLTAYFEEIEEKITIQEYESGEALLADAEEGYLQTDLIFMDIHMKGITGMNAARKLRELRYKMPIVFLTADERYAIESYEVEASGYLTKAFSEEKIKQTLQRIFKLHLKKRIPVKSKRQQRYPFVDEIMYIESDKHQVVVHMIDGSEIATTEKLGDIETKINDLRFLRCNQSYLVNMECIADVKEDFILVDGTQIPIRVRGRKNMLDIYEAYFMKKFVGGGYPRNRKIR